MTIQTLPAAPAMADTRFGLRSNTQTDLTSPITQSSQILEMQGARWAASYALPPMGRAQAAAWQAFLVALRGRAGRFYGYDPDARTARGSARLKAAGDLTVLAVSPEPSGNSLEIAGFDPMEAGGFAIGDYLAYDVGVEGRQLHMVTAEPAAADSNGIVTVSIEPPIRTAPAGGATIIVTDASCIMRLVEDDVGWDASRISRFGIRFEAVEVFG